MARKVLKKERRTSLIVNLALMMAGLVLVLGYFVSQTPGDGPLGAIGGPFTLVNGAGETVTDEDFLGKYLLIYFGYTYCPDVCPTSLSKVAGLLDALSDDEKSQIAGAFVSVDPDRDSGEILTEYGHYFHPQIEGLTGTRAQIDAMVNSYRVYYEIVRTGDDENYVIDHTSIVFVMGPDGKFITRFTHNAAVDEMVTRMRQAMK